MTTVKCLPFILLYIVAVQIIHTNSKTSTYWRLTPEGLIQPGDVDTAIKHILDDPIFSIITSTVHYGTSWTKRSPDADCPGCPENATMKMDGKDNMNKTGHPEDDEVLDCGKSVNFTYYDNLVGVANRLSHPNVPEPQVALIFKKKATDIDVLALERKLKKAKREKPKSVQLYNQIGNFWRLKGDTYKSIECFRRALAVSPHNAEVLLNLARVLFTLQYLDDAIYLTRRSLEVQPPDKSAWQQYFTLGEIFKAYGHYQEASLHMRHCLHLRPGFEPAVVALKELEATPDNNIHIYTLLIIVCLVLGVLLVIISSMDSNLESEYTEVKGQRHFNRAMAMRSLKMGISPRALRSKRYNGTSG
ncbi:hypothetical protein GE061_015704 [Apolygus lucorum]|uniref:Tetratricopeptide repeat protein 17 n=1 Tax=Apolygus lucorum TaxID=248454 RepID=A0A8S9XMW0_APOLU|nr:hypothetical protein GE061_015704 [Apolygus lucorum]